MLQINNDLTGEYILEKERTNVLLDKDIMILLKNLSRKEGKSITFIVREAVQEYLSRNVPKKDFGIIGIGESRYRDVSGDLKKYEKNINGG